MSALLATITLLLCITTEMFDVLTVDAYDIEHRESMVYVTKGSTAILPCVITGDYDTGKDAVNWEKYMLEDDTTGRHVSSAANAAVPFRDTGRYSVLYKQGTDRLDYSIQITSKYMCNAWFLRKIV
ncbi:hypothetical protein NP493_1811g00012 [Ridgeia piscesae]|uniref:Immunoglobulin V-set domain-containing protein n=1 Tax=Ridgeia piscesae TaxID=27915 RepID=A0AAD9JTI6_RIDPI|nr:hypothetical protein NP493_1811g00012 [Ridgeia piscesae]